jgi:subtilisin family serine protease
LNVGSVDEPQVAVQPEPVNFTAPGGDLHVPMPNNPSGQIVGPIPSYSLIYQQANQWNGRVGVGCTDGLDPNDPNADPSTCAETYALLQGTSMSTPHVTGVAALILSRFGKIGAGGISAHLARSATRKACPTPSPYQPYPADMPAEVCQSDRDGNGFYGEGEVDALAAVRGL